MEARHASYKRSRNESEGWQEDHWSDGEPVSPIDAFDELYDDFDAMEWDDEPDDEEEEDDPCEDCIYRKRRDGESPAGFDDEDEADDGCDGDARRLDRRALGRRGEEVAARYLRRMGYEILERNWRCRFGEADIVALDEETGDLVFVEVKTRSDEYAGLPEEAVTPQKRRRYERIALEYLRVSALTNLALRFDIIALTLVGPDRALMRHHRGAFNMGE